MPAEQLAVTHLLLIPVWFVLAIYVWTGAPQRWLRERGLTRHAAVLAQATVLGVAFAVISSLSTARDGLQLLLLCTWLVLLLYGAILLRVRGLHLP
jgi:hypothetical protein